jgi:hypothetical protein
MNRVETWMLVVAASAAVAGPALAAEETRTVAAFTGVEFSGIGRMNVTVGQEQSVTLTGAKKILGRVTTEVKDDTLNVEWHDRNEKRSWLWRFVMPDDHDDDDLTVQITVPRLSKLGVSGAARVNAKGIDSPSMDFSVTGAAKIRADGHADKLSLTISGAGDADLDHLVVKDAVVSISGAGKATIHPTDNLHAEISGVGSIRYEGEPKVTSNISGAGSIRAK